MRRVADIRGTLVGPLTVLAPLMVGLVFGAVLLVASAAQVNAPKYGRSLAGRLHLVADAYVGLVRGSLGSKFAIGETLIRTGPLIVIGAGIALALRAGVFVIGAEGQFILGAVGSFLAAYLARDLPSITVLLIAAVAGAAAGAAWAFLPGFLRARYRVNEILSTLLFNYFALYLLTYLLRAPMRPKNAPIFESDALVQKGTLPILVAGTRIHGGLFSVPIVLVGFALWARSVLGFRTDLFGQNPTLARQLGVSPTRTIIGVTVASGALAGVAGWMQVAGLDYRLYGETASGIGYLAILVAVLGGLQPGGLVAAAFLIGALQAGGIYIQQTTNVPSNLSDVIQAIVILGFAARLSPRLRRAWRQRRAAVGVLGEEQPLIERGSVVAPVMPPVTRLDHPQGNTP